ncbi:MAG: hypothetical protein SV062_03235 [Thermodesulfobacteriota bacterium]|nr:hypothetical protein [Thermodesulfobacteriota bacterium]
MYKKLFWLVIIVFIIYETLVPYFVSIYNYKNQSKQKLVKILNKDNEFILENDRIKIWENTTTIIWINWGKFPVRIKFNNGQKLQDCTNVPQGFILNEKGEYISSYLRYGGTASLFFSEHGIFDYMIIDSTGKERKKGRVVVEGRSFEKKASENHYFKFE